MSKVNMEPHGGFALLMAEAIQKQGISLRALAIATGYSYEQMRKIWQGKSSPSSHSLQELCKILKIDLETAKKIVTTDQVQRRHGSSAYTAVGLDPRFDDIAPLVPHLSDGEWAMFVTQIKAIVNQKRRTGVLGD